MIYICLVIITETLIFSRVLLVLNVIFIAVESPFPVTFLYDEELGNKNCPGSKETRLMFTTCILNSDTVKGLDMEISNHLRIHIDIGLVEM